ncbi:MAG: phospholipid carrier-dependent glycosyltransferase [Alphaproteobacteria bacterium]|nr:phospholipid carrier-dependent glycosyltransferase [Alphaproteobacteria bacterium]
MAQPPAPDLLDRLSRGVRAYVLLALITICGVAPGFFSIPPLDRDESRYAQATAQMLETGDYVRIAVQEAPRNKKPIGIHWLQAAAVAATTGVEAREIWAYRLPSMAGAILATLAAFWAGTALVGRRAAFAGAAMLGVCVLLSTEGMIAKTDSMLCGVTTLMMAALARLRVRPPESTGAGLAFLAWAALGAGVMIKGPVTPAVAALSLAALAVWERRIDWMRPLLAPWGPIAAALIVTPWFVAIELATQGAFVDEAVRRDLATKLFGGGEHPFRPPGLHLALLAFLSFPLAVALAPAARLAARAMRSPPQDETLAPLRVLVAWAVPIFLAFEIAPVKLAHYPLPAYPAIALLAGAGLVAMTDGRWTKTRWTSIGVATFAAGGLVAVCAALTAFLPPDGAPASQRVGQTAIVGAAVIAAWLVALAMARRADALVALALTAALTFTFVAREKLAPSMQSLLISREASQALERAGLHPRRADAPSTTEQPIWIVGYREPSLVFMTQTRARLADGATAGATAPTGAALLVEQRQRIALDAGLGARGLRFAPLGPPVTGRNYSNGEIVALTPGRVERAPQAADD